VVLVQTVKLGIPKETAAGETRVALAPGDVARLAKAALEVLIESGAGERAGYLDSAYADKGARIAESRQALFDEAAIIAMVRADGEPLPFRRGQICVGFLDPLWRPDSLEPLAASHVTAFAMELMPRITRAQGMDALSSMATIAGYRSVLLAAIHLPRIFPMLMTAAGTLAPAKVLIIGAGVAGLQAIATARRLGAVVSAYDVRPAVKEQVQSLGAKFLELPLETVEAEDKGGYAKAQDEAFYARQRELLSDAIAGSDVVITTAAVPGMRSPLLVTRDMVARMQPGTVVVDIAAERGGNCELTRLGKTVVENGVTVLGPENLPAAVPQHASQMYSRNITNFLVHLFKNGAEGIDWEDEIVKGTLVTRDGRIVHPAVLDRLAAAQKES
jgi:NAD(P) transhydrogenase subunit alpha